MDITPDEKRVWELVASTQNPKLKAYYHDNEEYFEDVAVSVDLEDKAAVLTIVKELKAMGRRVAKRM